MFRGFTTLNIDSKGRLAVPSRYRERLQILSEGELVLTINPLDRSLWLYPLPEWEIIESKLAEFSDYDKQMRMAKLMMRGYASDCRLDSQGRIMISSELREYANLKKQTVILAQGNKFEIWNDADWTEKRDSWLSELGSEDSEPSEALKMVSL